MPQELTPKQQPNHELVAQQTLPTEWSHPSTGVEQMFEGVKLGAIVGPDGWNAGYVDEVEKPVPQAGLVFGVDQASYGFTGIFAKALPGFRVEALTVDPDTTEATWAQAPEDGARLRVTADWGRMGEAPIQDWTTDTTFGEPGGRVGIVRVISDKGETKYFALGADFKGKEDSWRVTGGVVEIEQHGPSTLSTPEPKLPSGSDYDHLVDPNIAELTTEEIQKAIGKAAVRPETTQDSLSREVDRRMGVASAIRSAEDERGLPHVRDLR